MNKYIEALENGYFVREEKEDFEPSVFWLTGYQTLQGDKIIEDKRVLWTSNKEIGRFERDYNEKMVSKLEKHFDNMVAEHFTLTILDIYTAH